jgi:hypothetical protein
MVWLKSDGEVAGVEVLNVAVIAGATLLLMASLWTSAPPGAQAVQAATAQPMEQVVVVAHPGRVS